MWVWWGELINEYEHLVEVEVKEIKPDSSVVKWQEAVALDEKQETPM